LPKVPLTTIDQNPVAMGAFAATPILDLAEDKRVGAPLQEFLPFCRLERESSASQHRASAIGGGRK
jgi:DNA-binding LacI/PurR family transcriptional regulator